MNRHAKSFFPLPGQFPISSIANTCGGPRLTARSFSASLGAFRSARQCPARSHCQNISHSRRRARLPLPICCVHSRAAFTLYRLFTITRSCLFVRHLRMLVQGLFGINCLLVPRHSIRNLRGIFLLITNPRAAL